MVEKENRRRKWTWLEGGEVARRLMIQDRLKLNSACRSLSGRAEILASSRDARMIASNVRSKLGLMN